MIIVALGLVAGIAYLAWTMPIEQNKRRVPIRVRTDDHRRPRR
ncbi:MAG: hypothetical protein AAGH68_03880 [Pseudomonadota bacterium]